MDRPLEGFAKGEIHINRGAEEALLGPKATSILLVGVTRIIGDFEKDDIVKVINEEGVQLESDAQVTTVRKHENRSAAEIRSR